MEYVPYDERPVSLVYRQILERIIAEGELTDTQMEEPAWTVLGHQFRYDLRHGFPLITERDLGLEGKRPVFRQALGEVCAFMNGARTHGELCEFGCNWWFPWVSKEKCAKRGLLPGDLGAGSYGPAWHDFPTAEVTPFNQIRHLVEQIREMPHLRTHFLTPWIPQYCVRGRHKLQQVVVAPCHGWVHFRVLGNRLHLHHFQRSADAPVGLPANLVMYGALLLMMAQVTGHEPGSLVYTVSDLHVYERQVPDVRDMLATSPQPLPTVTVDPNVKSIFDFRAEHFTLTDYHPQLPRRRIDTPV